MEDIRDQSSHEFQAKASPQQHQNFQESVHCIHMDNYPTADDYDETVIARHVVTEFNFVEELLSSMREIDYYLGNRCALTKSMPLFELFCAGTLKKKSISYLLDTLRKLNSLNLDFYDLELRYPLKNRSPVIMVGAIMGLHRRFYKVGYGYELNLMARLEYAKLALANILAGCIRETIGFEILADKVKIHHDMYMELLKHSEIYHLFKSRVVGRDFSASVEKRIHTVVSVMQEVETIIDSSGLDKKEGVRIEGIEERLFFNKEGKLTTKRPYKPTGRPKKLIAAEVVKNKQKRGPKFKGPKTEEEKRDRRIRRAQLEKKRRDRKKLEMTARGRPAQYDN